MMGPVLLQSYASFQCELSGKGCRSRATYGETRMLVLTRKVGEKLVIDGIITVVVTKISGDRITLGIEAPRDVKVLRGELNKPSNPDEPEQQTSDAA